MEKILTPIPGCFELVPKVFEDTRGRLIKTFHEDTFKSLELETDFAEEYYSTSGKNVLRGLHFQEPPYDHVKLVTCLSGKIFDVVVDLRKDSPTYKKKFSIILDSDIGNMLYVPRGMAHGFYVLGEGALFLNRTTTIYNGDSEGGIKWDSCGIEWPTKNPIVSNKDRQLITLDNYKSPF
ncbi:dTDP-4-dehydrorhamnose 3,5-epimerase [Aureibaculum sp. 2210JD6-5]|uniref:dTDP-4-dehydrorhamnose 3,5-epimerase n=1 Tax=Aureibaculum sp. 2210JD6-5 TaxID=3103957 RepID=UPI002AAE2F56|nr:dTDP-4-dehydrorhamnose 3,5-epimerase [Aureibaculum sp. 2210JD6-5]MDY7394103.1 dTDP-4-dehydrorhamnose 3,5-epimerase [Aureibaculum sp. 2210JD6-5]